MCGICGILRYGGGERITEPILKKMASTLVHRGPDDEGTYVNETGKVGFGFRRLSIIDLSPAGHQPMFTPEGEIAIVYNGEIYNHAVLRKILEAKGYKYRSRSDTESILYAYQEWGIEFCHTLLGMFAIAIHDRPKNRLVLVRDRIGVKPLYYFVGNGLFIFASEIKAILEHPAVPRELDAEALDHYLTFAGVPAPRTLFKGVRKLQAGHRLVVSESGDVHEEPYWDLAQPNGRPTIDIDGQPAEKSAFVNSSAVPTEVESVRVIRTLLKQSVKDRMMSDVPFGVFLSGGIDSSMNVALMAQLMNRPVDTFSVGFKDLERYNELGYARRVADEFRTNHHEILITQRDAYEFLPKLVWHQDEPVADPVCIPLFFVSKLARDSGTIVVQVGEGSDELFIGYPWMRREWKFYNGPWKMYTSLPRGFRNAALGTAALAMVPTRMYLPFDYLRKGTEGDELFWGGGNFFTETHKRLMLSRRNPVHPSTGELARQWHQDLLAANPNADYLARMSFVEFRQRLPQLLLMRVDKVSMATSVETRVPFLDHRLVEYAMTIPASLKLKEGQTKYILKQAVKGIVPDDIIDRRKQGFAAPIDEWFRNEWFSFVRTKLLESRLVKEQLLRKDFVEALVKQHKSRKRKTGHHLFILLNLVLWHELWIEGKRDLLI